MFVTTAAVHILTGTYAHKFLISFNSLALYLQIPVDAKIGVFASATGI